MKAKKLVVYLPTGAVLLESGKDLDLDFDEKSGVITCTATTEIKKFVGVPFEAWPEPNPSAAPAPNYEGNAEPVLPRRY